MSLFSRFFKQVKTSSPLLYENTGFGLRFRLPTEQKNVFEDSLPTYQHLVLQQLLEAGDAHRDASGIHVENAVLCRLDETARDILGLPEPWPGSFELEIHGTTTLPDFSVNLRVLPLAGVGSIPATTQGPFLHVEGQDYLPDMAQWHALQAIARHGELSAAERTETANLATVYALQQACLHGASIDLRRFKKVSVTEPEYVGVNIAENADGSLRLWPNFGLGLSPEDVERRLGQLEKVEGKRAVLRIGTQLVLLDERRLAAVREILTSRRISAKDKRQFFKTPTAWLNAALVDLDIGVSLRVHGVEIFQKAYLGTTEDESLSWFNETGQAEPHIIPLASVGVLLEEENDFNLLKQVTRTAIQKGHDFVPFKDRIVLLPETVAETDSILSTLGQTCEKKWNKDKDPCIKETPVQEKQQITVKIDLHDDDEMSIHTEDDLQYYNGNLYTDCLKYSMYPYQEEGVRWILGLMQPLLQNANKDIFYGGLLADDMGLGKTFMVLAALNIYKELIKAKGDEIKPVLAVMPVVLLENWQQELKQVFSNSPFEVIILQANAHLKNFLKENARRENILHAGEELPSLEQIRYALKIGPDAGSGRLDMPGRLVLTNYDTLRDYQFSLCRVDWGCVIFDEAQEIKNPNALKSRAAKGLKADFRLAVTGTPVENSLTDLWSLFDTVKPGLLGAFQDFRRCYVAPIRNASTGAEKESVRGSVGKKLRQAVGPFMLRRTKEEKLPGLPRKMMHDGMDDPRYSVTMSGLQLERYNAVISAVVAARQSGDGMRVRQILLPSLRKLNNVSLHPAFLDGGQPLLGKNNEEMITVLRQSAKFILLLSILDEIRTRGEKVIIFAINRNVQIFLAITLGQYYFDNPRRIMIVNGETKSVTSAANKHGSASRMKLIREFEAQDGFNIICMSPLAAGVGLTVTGANNVIHLERHWNPAKEAQATDRVYRIGAKKDVHVYIPILLHPQHKSFDVNLNELLGRKITLKDAVIAQDEIHGDDFDSDAVFGTTLHTDRVRPDWLKSLGWEHFEALTAILAQREWGGTAYLTPRSGDHGADVVLLGPPRNIIIQCKTSLRSFGESEAACQPHSARSEYGKRRNCTFDTAILAVNAPRVEDNVRERAAALDVIIWDISILENLLNKHFVSYSELETLLASPRLERY